MTRGKIINITATVILGGIGLFIFMLYATIKTKSTGIDDYEPFKSWVGKTVTLDKQTVVFQEKIRMVDNNHYPYLLLDNQHPHWQYVAEQQRLGELTEIKIIPAGATLTLEKAVQYTNGVSGSSYPTMFGSISDGDTTYKIGYPWGQRDFSKPSSDPKPWQFHQAPWQLEQDNKHYYLPTAEWW